MMEQRVTRLEQSFTDFKAVVDKTASDVEKIKVCVAKIETQLQTPGTGQTCIAHERRLGEIESEIKHTGKKLYAIAGSLSILAILGGYFVNHLLSK